MTRFGLLAGKGFEINTPEGAVVEVNRTFAAYQASERAMRRAREVYRAAHIRLLQMQLTCDHNWEFRYEGRHGSDKGVKHYTCTRCIAKRQG